MKQPGAALCDLCSCAPCQCDKMRKTGGTGNRPFEVGGVAGRAGVHTGRQMASCCPFQSNVNKRRPALTWLSMPVTCGIHQLLQSLVHSLMQSLMDVDDSHSDLLMQHMIGHDAQVFGLLVQQLFSLTEYARLFKGCPSIYAGRHKVSQSQHSAPSTSPQRKQKWPHQQQKDPGCMAIHMILA